jgi:SAM-dependent methyltransferase
MRWTEIRLAPTWIDEIPQREQFVSSRVAGKKVLDLGCVEHDAQYMDREWWLHRYVAATARECVGADIDAPGVEAMRQAGFDAIVLDINDGADGLEGRVPFEAVVAGELLEHLAAPQVLFDFARDVLCSGGELVLTTPNPYAPARVRAGQLRLVWENVDHVFLAFPDGVAEMADRAGLTLTVAGTAHPGWRPPDAGSSLGALWASVREWASARRIRGAPSVTWQSPIDILSTRLLRRSSQIGETAIYVLTKPA